MIKRVLTFVVSAGITVAALYASLGPQDYSRHWDHHHHHCADEAGDTGQADL